MTLMYCKCLQEGNGIFCTYIFGANSTKYKGTRDFSPGVRERRTTLKTLIDETFTGEKQTKTTAEDEDE